MTTATHVERRHAFRLDRPIETVLGLFTPRGEEAWVAGWAPDHLHPADGTTGEGMVFRTRHGGEETLWACVLWQPERHRVRYVRVTPVSRLAFVDVRCRAIDTAVTEVTVGYDITALAADGERVIAETTEARFAEQIEDWRRLIEANTAA